MSVFLLQKSFEYMFWADARVAESLREAESPPDQAVELYAHVLAAELVWLDRIQGATQSVPVWPSLDVAGCLDLRQTAKLRYADYMDGLVETDLSTDVDYRNSAGLVFTSKVLDILMHVALHGAYHRGQVALLVRQAGLAPIPTDYIAFVRGAPAATRNA